MNLDVLRSNCSISDMYSSTLIKVYLLVLSVEIFNTIKELKSKIIFLEYKTCNYKKKITKAILKIIIFTGKKIILQGLSQRDER